MADGMPCWNCQEPIPGARWRLGPMRRVFCSDQCEQAFKTPPKGDDEDA